MLRGASHGSLPPPAHSLDLSASTPSPLLLTIPLLQRAIAERLVPWFVGAAHARSLPLLWHDPRQSHGTERRPLAEARWPSRVHNASFADASTGGIPPPWWRTGPLLPCQSRRAAGDRFGDEGLARAPGLRCRPGPSLWSVREPPTRAEPGEPLLEPRAKDYPGDGTRSGDRPCGRPCTADQLDAQLGSCPAPLLRPLPVDLEELAGILEGDPLNAGGRIDLRTGEVWPQAAIEYAANPERKTRTRSMTPSGGWRSTTKGHERATGTWTASSRPSRTVDSRASWEELPDDGLPRYPERRP